MARVMDIITNDTEVWQLKDELGLLNQDPMKMRMGVFKKYVEAYKWAKLAEHLENGKTDAQALSYVRRTLVHLEEKWREAAKAHNEAKQ